MNRIFTKRLLPLLLIAVLGVQSCEDSTGTDNSGGTTSDNKATVGSTYTFYQETTAGSTTNDDTVVYTVTKSPTAVEGKSDVYIFSSSIDPNDDRTIAYESNGNISVLFPKLTDSDFGLQWMTIPVSGSGGSVGLVLSDLTLDLGIGPIRTEIVGSALFAGTESVSINGKPYTAKKITVRNTTTVTAQGVPVSSFDEDYFWWIPEIGYYGKSEVGGAIDPDTQLPDELTTESLVRFTAK